MSIRCFRFYADGRVEKSDSLPTEIPSGDASNSDGAPSAWADSVWWIDLSAPSPEQIDSLARLLRLDPHTTGELHNGDGRANIDYFDHYCCLLMYGMLGADAGDPPLPRMLNLICTSRVLATVHDMPCGSVEHVASRVDRIANQVGKKGVGHLLFLHLDKLVDNSMQLAKRYEEELERLEDRSVDVGCRGDLLEDLAEARRRVLDLWQVQVAHREVLIELCENELEQFSPEEMRQMEHVRDHIKSALEVVEILRGMVGDVRENYRTTLSLRSAEAMNKLTVFAGLMLPLSLIAGIYGMNVPLWPDPTRPATFWLIMAAMAGLLVGFTVYFRRRNWL